MLKLPAFFFLLCCTFALSAQQTIKGKVVNELTGAPIPGSSVFITNTSKGTVSDNAGVFELTNVPYGKHELIISSIGYETNVFAFSDDQLPLQLRVEMTIKVKELENVTVEPSVEEGWDKWGKTFTENFIGYTENAGRCVIKNHDKIRFRFYRKSNRLIAYCDEPLVIVNKALGYTINYQLEDFEVNFKDRSSLFLGYSLFIDNEKDRKSQDKKRRAAYEGSMMHFIRSLYADSLLENGFEVRRMWKVRNEEKQRVKAIYLPARINNMITINGTITVKAPNATGEKSDSTIYYEKIMRQPDITEHYGKELLRRDSLIVKEDGPHRLMYYPDFLLVTYKKEMEHPDYLRMYMQNRKPGFQQSILYLPELNPIWIEGNGNFYNPKDMYFYGYWGWSDKMGDSLPLDYEP